VHQVGFSLHNYIEMPVKQNIKSMKPEFHMDFDLLNTDISLKKRGLSVTQFEFLMLLREIRLL